MRRTGVHQSRAGGSRSPCFRSPNLSDDSVVQNVYSVTWTSSSTTATRGRPGAGATTGRPRTSWPPCKESALSTWFSSHPGADVAVYREAGTLAVANATADALATTVHAADGDTLTVDLGPGEIKWFAVP